MPGAAGPIAARIHRPDGPDDRPLPTVLFVHGGGFLLGDLDTHDNQARRLCRDADCVVVSVAYRLAPEHPWPAGRDDVVTAMRWVVANIARFGADAERVAVAGDSAGGNLAALAALAARDAGMGLCAQLLLYPSTDMRDEDQWPSRVQNATGLFLTEDDLRWFEEHYIPAGTDRADPGLSPLLADHRGLAPAVVVTAQYDPLRDEGDAYAAALQHAGVQVDHVEAPGMIHGFFDMWRASDGVEAAVADVVARFRRLLWTA